MMIDDDCDDSAFNEILLRHSQKVNGYFQSYKSFDIFAIVSSPHK